MSSTPPAYTHVSLAGKSALHWAAAVNNVEATLLLLKNGANRDMQDNKVQSGPRAGGQARPGPAPPVISVDGGGSGLDGTLRKGVGLPQGRARVLRLPQAVLHVARCSLAASLVSDGPSAVARAAPAPFSLSFLFPLPPSLFSDTRVFLSAFPPLRVGSGFPSPAHPLPPPTVVLLSACPFSASFDFSQLRACCRLSPAALRMPDSCADSDERGALSRRSASAACWSSHIPT